MSIPRSSPRSPITGSASRSCLPGTGFLEIAFAVARQWLKADRVTIANFEILKPLDLTNGRSYELMSRVAPGTNVVEISSRPRLTQAAWALHARGKMLRAAGEPRDAAAAPASGAASIDGDALYEMADAAGLHYGPAFRLARRVACDGALSVVELTPGADATPYLADPVRIDAGIHGLIRVLPELRAAERGVAYVPIQLECATLHAAFGTPASSRMVLRRKGERSILADCRVFDAEGRLLVDFVGVQCQAVPVRRALTLETTGLVERFVPASGALAGASGVLLEPRDIVQTAAALDAGAGAGERAEGEALRLLDAWATAAAYQMACGLGARGRVDPDRLVASGALAREQLPWLIAWLGHLEAAGLAEKDGARWKIVRDPSLPRASDVLRALASEHPERAADLLLAGEVSDLAANPGALAAFARPALASSFHALATEIAANAGGFLERLLRAEPHLFPADRSLRILAAGTGATLEAGGRGATRVDRLDDTAPLAPASYDLVVAADRLHHLAPPELSRLARALAPGGLLVAVEAQPSLFKDMVLGTEPDWFRAARPSARAASCARARNGSSICAQRASPASKRATFSAAGAATLLAAKASAPALAAAAAAAPEAEAVCEPDDRRGRDVAEALEARLRADAGASADLVYFVPPEDRGAPADQVAARCLAIKAAAERCGAGRARSGRLRRRAARRCRRRKPGRGRRVGVLAHARQRNAASRHAAGRSRARARGKRGSRAAVSPICVGDGRDRNPDRRRGDARAAARTHGRRRRSGRRRRLAAHLPRGGPRACALAAQLAARARARGNRNRDRRDRPQFPRRHVAALAPARDDMLEDGFAGPTFGLECAGRVVRVGAAVRDLRAGDRVLAFAPPAFATHVHDPGRTGRRRSRIG